MASSPVTIAQLCNTFPTSINAVEYHTFDLEYDISCSNFIEMFYERQKFTIQSDLSLSLSDISSSFNLLNTVLTTWDNDISNNSDPSGASMDTGSRIRLYAEIPPLNLIRNYDDCCNINLTCDQFLGYLKGDPEEYADISTNEFILSLIIMDEAFAKAQKSSCSATQSTTTTTTATNSMGVVTSVAVTTTPAVVTSYVNPIKINIKFIIDGINDSGCACNS